MPCILHELPIFFWFNSGFDVLTVEVPFSVVVRGTIHKCLLFRKIITDVKIIPVNHLNLLNIS